MPPVSANATNNVAMWLGSFASLGSFRKEVEAPRATLVKMIVTSAIGSIAGAIILLHTSNATFAGLIPFLLLGATTLFIFGPKITKAARASGHSITPESPLGLCGQFVIAVYGGFFGAAIGILLLALLGVLGMTDLRKTNALKVVLQTIINGAAVAPFVFARVIALEPAIFMSAGAIAGGFAGASLVKRLPSSALRLFVIVVACTMTAYFFWTTYFRHR